MTPIIVALDFAEEREALELARRLDPNKCRMKIGKEMFTRFGPAIVEKIRHLGYEVFLDLKFHDIPNTVAKAVAAAASLDVWMVNVHASGGRAMMESAVEVLQNSTGNKPILTAVTALTSLETPDLLEVGFGCTSEQLVERLAAMAQDCGLDGVVCSSQEASALRALTGSDFLLVTPGIRPDAASLDDQKRTMTPVEALQAGSNYLVIGRPITRADDPFRALGDIESQIEGLIVQ